MNDLMLRLLWVAGILSMRAAARNPTLMGQPEYREWVHARWGEIDAVGALIGSPGAPITADWYANKAHGFGPQ